MAAAAIVVVVADAWLVAKLGAAGYAAPSLLGMDLRPAQTAAGEGQRELCVPWAFSRLGCSIGLCVWL